MHNDDNQFYINLYKPVVYVNHVHQTLISTYNGLLMMPTLFWQSGVWTRTSEFAVLGRRSSSSPA